MCHQSILSEEIKHTKLSNNEGIERNEKVNTESLINEFPSKNIFEGALCQVCIPVK